MTPAMHDSRLRHRRNWYGGVGMLASTANGLHGIGGWRRREERLLSPGLAVRLLARLRSNSLDRRLSAGADSSRSGLLAARAAQLGRRGTRFAVARGIEKVAFARERPLRRYSVLPARTAVSLNRPALLDLAAQLRRPGALYVRGIAAARLMLVDGTGPMYTDRRGEALAAELERVDDLLRARRA